MLVSLEFLAATLLAVAANAAPSKCETRQVAVDASYDYVIIGAGAAGLTLANRLSEDSSVKVLVIEAGDFDQDEDFVTIPGMAGGAVGTKYDWNVSYAANAEIGGREVAIPLGKVVGGSTKLNRMVFDRGSESDFNRWAELGNDGWGWDGLLDYHKKQEKFTPPSADMVAQWAIDVDAAAHGDSGNIHVSYANFFWPLTDTIVKAAAELGIPPVKDQAAGAPVGAYFCPHNTDPATVTRSSADEAYYEPAKARANLQILTGQQVTRLITTAANSSSSSSAGVRVAGVEYAASAAGPRSVASVSGEAILAAGALHSPQILQVSGIGAPSLHQQIGVRTVVDLPAVGHNLQDHVMLVTVASVTTDQPTSLTADAAFAAAALAQYKANGTGPYSTPTGDFLLFLPLATVASSNASAAAIVAAATSAAANASAFLPADAPAEVAAGYAAQLAVQAQRLARADSAPVEIIWDSGTLVLGLEHPQSRGRVAARSNSTFDAPDASPGFLAHPADVAVLVEAVKYTRTIRDTAAVQALAPVVEVLPGANVTSDEAIAAWIRQTASTLFHPAGSCKMGARADGGVVDGELRVYGTANLRVVDASVMPLLPAAHIMTAVYAVAEKAADIIKGTAKGTTKKKSS